MEVVGASATLTNVTVNGNGGRGVYVDTGSVTLTNTLLAANTFGNCLNTDDGTVVNGGYNLDDGTSCGFGGANHSLSSVPANLDPAGLQDNGGPTKTISLLKTSAARNAGNNNICIATGPDQVNGVDQRGFLRPSGAGCDIGASESDGTTYRVTSEDDDQNGIGPGTLRAGWKDANVGTILFPPEASGGTINLVAVLPPLTRGLRLVGPSPEPLRINRLLVANENIITVQETGASLVASNLVLTGSAPGIGVKVLDGNGLTLANVTVSDVAIGVANFGTATLLNTTISGNGTGVHNGGTATLTNTTVSGNVTGVENHGDMTLTNSTISGNGTGVANQGGNAKLINVTLSGNDTGVAHTTTGGTRLFNVTLSGNGTALSTTVTGLVTLANTLVANSTTANCSGSVENDGHNLDSGTSCGFGSANGSLSNTPAGLDPNGLQDNGGPTKTIALLPTSAALNAGDADICAHINLGQPLIENGVDQRGVTRPQGAGCDIGAYEFRAACAVTTLADTGAGSLRQCLLDADVRATITVAPTGTITLASDLPPVTRAVTIAGPGANLLTIDRANLGDTAIFTVPTGGNLTASGFTLTGASRGVSITGGSATLNNAILSGNATGVHVQGGSATLTNATLNGNGESVVAAGGSTTLTNATISDNSTGVSVVGGIATLTNVTLNKNVVGVARSGGTVDLTNTIVANSTNDDCTGAITNLAHNLDTDASCGFEGVNGSLSGIPAGLDPTGLHDNGGPTRTIKLLPTSPAINAANSTFCVQTGPGKVNGIDQRGISRPQGLGCDIGAYELDQPTILSLTPATAKAGSASFTLTVHGTTFRPTSEIYWQGHVVTTTYVDDSTLTATIAAARLTTPLTAEVTVVTPGADGATSTPWPFYVTPANATVTAADSGASGTTDGTAVASVGGDPGSAGSVSATASGTGTVSVARFANPPAIPPSGATTTYADIYPSEGNTFTSVTIVNCNLTRGSVAYWWNGTRWVRIDPQSYNPTTRCITITITAGSTPSLAQLTGTYIAAIEGPPSTLTLTTTGTGGGTIARAPDGIGEGPFDYDLDATVTLTAIPNGGSTFVGWMVDGVYRGWANALTITMGANHTVQATFAPTKTFTADVPGDHPNAEAITELASRGNILGYDSTHYGPDDGVQRAQMAVLIARATPNGPGTPTNGTLTPPACTVANTWDCEDWGNTFTDRSGVPASLWRAAGTLQHYGVAFGYTAQDCANKGRTFPCYGPTDSVSYAQTIAFIARAMIAKGYWVAQPNAPLPGGNVPGVLATPIRTFAYYTGGIPNAPADWNAEASRGWFAEALWAALDTYWGTDGLLPDGRDAGGRVP
ncbi:MAG: choice-of-anchor Q domain-containing protein [Thermomicrobiales bacterium]